MAELATITAIFGLLLVAAMASTVKPTGEVDNRNKRPSSGVSSRDFCWDQYQRPGVLKYCRHYLKEVSWGANYRGQCDGDDTVSGLVDGAWESKHLYPCCRQISRIDERCRCEALRYVTQKIHGSSTYRCQGWQQTEYCANRLPRICGIGKSCLHRI